MKLNLSVALAVFLVACWPGLGATGSLFYLSEVGDPVGQGEEHTYSDSEGDFSGVPSDEYGVDRVHARYHHQLSGDWHYLDLQAADGEYLVPGQYVGASQYIYEGGDSPVPRMNFGIASRDCSGLTGNFNVTQVARDYRLRLLQLSAHWDQQCSGVDGDPTLFGSISFDYGATIGPTSFGPDNLIVTYSDFVWEYTPAGDLLQVIPITGFDGVPDGNNFTRDLIRGGDGAISLINETEPAMLSRFDSATGSWTHHGAPSWISDSSSPSGALAAFDDRVIVADSTNVMLSFDIDSGEFSAFGPTPPPFPHYHQVTLGHDGYLYCLNGTSGLSDGIDVFNPITGAFVREIELSSNDSWFRGLAVNAAGELFGCTWQGEIYHFAADGTVLNSVDLGFDNFGDLELSPSGQIAVGMWDGKVVVTDETLTSFTWITLPIFDHVSTTDVAFTSLPPASPWIHVSSFETGDLSEWSSSVGNN